MTAPFTQVPNEVFDYASEIGATGITVYVALLSYAYKKDSCTPTIESLAKRSGISLSTAKRSLKTLQDVGLVTVQHRYNADGQTSSRYRLRLTVKPKVYPRKQPRSTTAVMADLPAKITEESWAGLDGVALFREDAKREVVLSERDFDDIPF